MLEVNLKHKIGALEIDVSFENAGGITALMGASGSGKTSILNMISGLTQPNQGQIVLDGKVLFDEKQALNIPPYQRRIGYIFQEPRLFPHLNVRHNLLYGRFFAKEKSTEIEFKKIIEVLDIADLLARRVAKLSGGEKQRVAIGRALLMKPKLLLADEPLSAVDEARKQEIFPYFSNLPEEFQVPVLFVTHIKSEAESLAQKIITIENGKII